MRSKDEIGRFSLRSSEKITVEELEDYDVDDRDIYFVYLIGYQGYVRDQAEMLFDPDEEEAIITWNGDTERGEAPNPERAAIEWVDDTFTGNGESGEEEAAEEEDEAEDD